MRTIVYVDGFNLYYGAVKDTLSKWLDIHKLCQALLPKNKIKAIKYFTARVSARPGDPGKPTRQQIYLRALRTLPNLEIIYGHFLEHNVRMPLASSLPDNPQFVEVVKTEEKDSDVNIAAHLLNDGYKERYQVAVLVTNDSDLVTPIRIVRRELQLPVGILNPHRKPAYALKKTATFIKPIRKGALASSQFPDKLSDSQGSFHKPSIW